VTAGQAFLAFVLLLLSLAASFTFGLMVGKGQGDERLVVKRDPPVVSEGSEAKTNEAKLVELDVPKRDRVEAPVSEAQTPVVVEEETPAPAEDATPGASSDAAAPASQPSAAPVVTEHKASAPVAPEVRPAQSVAAPAVAAVKPPEAKPVATAPKVAVYAQLLSSNDAKTAEGLAARLIDAGFTSAYVERLRASAGMTYRVRVKFSSEDEARAAVDRLRSIAKSEPWITKQ
jgi:hypothetical protein